MSSRWQLVGVPASGIGSTVQSLPHATGRPLVGGLLDVPSLRRLVGVPPLGLGQLRIVSPRPRKPLRILLRIVPLPLTIVAVDSLHPPPYPRWGTLLSQLRVFEVPPERLRIGDLHPLSQLCDGPNEDDDDD